jgi:hypothetical protein
MGSLFEKLDRGQPPAEAPPPEIIRMGPAAAIIPPAGPEAHPTEKLLDWLINRWTKPTVSLRELQRHGPNGSRDWESAMDQCNILTERGWLMRIETRRRDNRVWRILRGQANATVSATPS